MVLKSTYYRCNTKPSTEMYLFQKGDYFKGVAFSTLNAEIIFTELLVSKAPLEVFLSTWNIQTEQLETITRIEFEVAWAYAKTEIFKRI